MKIQDVRSAFRNRALLIVLALVILGMLGMLVYFLTSANLGERYTQFYIVGVNGKATGYPVVTRVGEEGKVIVGIVNHEHKVVSYRLEIMIDEVENNKVGPVVLKSGQKWEGEVSYRATKVGSNQKVGYLLFKDDEAKPYLDPLNLWVIITP